MFAAAPLAVPSRAQISNWEKERAWIETTIQRLTVERELLDSKIRESWLSRAPAVPVDIIHCVIAALENEIGDISDGPDRTDLRFAYDACLVARAWLPAGRTALYRSISLRKIDRSKFWATMEMSPHLRSHIKNIWDFFGRNCEWPHNASFLPNCQVHLDIVYGEALEYPRCLRVMDSDQVRTVKIHNGQMPTDALWRNVIGLRCWRTLEELSLYSFPMPFANSADRHALDEPLLPKLHTLTLESCDDLLFPRFASNTLRHLTIKNCMRIQGDPLVDLASTQSMSLRSFSLEDGSIATSPDSFVLDDIALLARQLVIFKVQGAHSLHMSTQLLSNLSPSVRIATLMAPAVLRPQELLDFLETRKATVLRRLHICLSRDVDRQDPLWEDLFQRAKDECVLKLFLFRAEPPEIV